MPIYHFSLNMNPKMTTKDAAEFLGVSLQAVQQNIKRNNLPHGKVSNRIYFGHETAKSLFKLQSEPHVATFMVLKGGVGK